MERAIVLVRLVDFVSIMLGFGGIAFRVYALGSYPAGVPSGVAAADALVRFDAWLAGIVRGSAVAALAAGVALLSCESAAMAGSAAAMVDWHTLGEVLLGTDFGRVWCWHLAAAAALVLCLFVMWRGRWGMALAPAGLMLASLGWTGHAAIGEGVAGIGRELNQSVHLLAGGLWLGGLVPLGRIVEGARRPGAAGELALARAALPAFSQMGYAAVFLLALTGAVNTWLLVGGWPALVGTPYGRLLGLKILLFLAMVAVALVNRWRLVPRLGDAPAATTTALARAILVEQGLGLAILAVVSLLGTWAPAIDAARM
jgi:putative copper resistance protein D